MILLVWRTAKRHHDKELDDVNFRIAELKRLHLSRSKGGEWRDTSGSRCCCRACRKTPVDGWDDDKEGKTFCCWGAKSADTDDADSEKPKVIDDTWLVGGLQTINGVEEWVEFTQEEWVAKMALLKAEREDLKRDAKADRRCCRGVCPDYVGCTL